MNKLPRDFKYRKNGIEVRLVNEKDAEFILSLRLDPSLNQYIHSTDNDIEKQRQWIREYKIRENAGLDYYFIYSMDDEPFGLDRAYRVNPEDNSYMWGSWICKPGVTAAQIMLQYIASADIINNCVGLELNTYMVSKGNLKVLYYHRKTLRSNEIGESGDDILFSNTKQMREEASNRFKRILRIENK